jgi:hypothetical protein
MDKTESQIRERLKAYYDADDIELWIALPQELLKFDAPRELIDAGRGDEVLRLIDQLDACVYL